jgi:hypothetical protein
MKTINQTRLLARLCLALLLPVFLSSGCRTPMAGTNVKPPTQSVTLRDFKLVGDLATERASFTLTATAHVDDTRGGILELLSGPVALTEIGPHPKWQVRVETNGFVLAFDRAGDFPVELKFTAAVHQNDGWSAVDFHIAPSTLQPVALRGLAAGTQFRFPGAARPERKGSEFASYLPSDGSVKLSWKEARPEGEGKLFYAAEMLSQISVAPGLMRQSALPDFKVMQGELNRVTLLLRGAGEVTRVQGEHVLSWNVETSSSGVANERRLVVQLNEPQKDAFALLVQMQTPLGAFPQTTDAMQIRPDSATRFAGYYRIVNDGAVRLEVVQASGLSQISPEQFPETETTKALFHGGGTQRFAYRFSGGEYALGIQADQILPELTVSQVIDYHLAENESAIEAEIELEVREAPLRELLLNVPKGYAIARLNASDLSDYFLRESPDQPEAELRLVYGQPVSGRQVIQLRLERNQALGATNWPLPRIEIPRAKSVRGHVGVSSDPGFRLTPERTSGLTDIATAFFPRKVNGIQAAFRLSDPAWEAAMRVERLPQTVQADVFHLFSIGEGIAYGSSVMNYEISGAPVSSFRVELSNEFYNVEFTGKDIRNWQKTDGGYIVQLHTPVGGSYTLLATYERPFKARGDTLAFTGARPLDAQSEQGHTIVVSAYQFDVKPTDVSPGLLELDPGEVPAEYRLFFDAPILKAYRYTTRPFNLQLALSPLAQADSVSQVVDRASITNYISKEGQVLTDVRYFVKNRGNPNFRLTLAKDTDLWSATVNGAPVIPVVDGDARLIPLPQRADPNAVLTVDLKLASQSADPQRLTIGAPKVAAPVLLAEWKLEPDTGQRLVYRGGSLTPVGGTPDGSGFAALAALFTGDQASHAVFLLVAALILMGSAVVMWRWASRHEVRKSGVRQLVGIGLGLVAFVIAAAIFVNLGELSSGYVNRFAPRDLTFVAPVQQAGSTLSLEVGNLPYKASQSGVGASVLPGLLALGLWIFSMVASSAALKFASRILGWTLLAWAALRLQGGAGAFFYVLVAFLFVYLALPALRQLWRLSRRTEPGRQHPAQGGAPAVAALLFAGLVWSSIVGTTNASPQGQRPDSYQPGPSAQVTTQMENERQRRDSLVAGCSVAEWPAPHDSAPLALNGPRAFNDISDDTDDTEDDLPYVARCDRDGRTPTAVAATTPQTNLPVAQSITQDIRVEQKFALATVRIRWEALKGQALPLVFEPAVLTNVKYPTNSLKLIQAAAGSKRADELLAEQDGTFDLEVRYQLQVRKWETQSDFALPTQYGLINQINLTLADVDVDVFSPQAVSIQRETAGSNTVATLVLSPQGDAWIGWKPRSRDVKSEKPVFYAEIYQLYVPSAGVIEGVHHAAIRPAQGELSEMIFDLPPGASVTDVIDPASSAPAADASASRPQGIVSLWRFDPDARKLRVTLNPPQSRPFALVIRSQVPTGPLPFEQKVGLLSAEGAAGQIGLLGVATGNEVQLDNLAAESFSSINLEDFPSVVATRLQNQMPGLTVRRAYRYSDVKADATLKASPVEPDVRVETQDTLSLGEDRTVLAANATVDITRAGIFRLSFLLPAGFDVESVSGAALSHWTELKTDAGRVITLNLKGKTEGRQQFAISLAGPGAKAAKAWDTPKIVIREANKQQGTLVIVPEQGMRVQTATREGVTPLDPQKSGIRQKGVLAFRVLQTPWNLALDIEQVDPWIQVTSLQHAIVNEAQVKVTANLQYQIENTGLKAFRVFLPTNAENVRFQGDQVADFLIADESATNGMQGWDVKLHRRVIGQYFLQATYDTPLVQNAAETELRGVQAADVNLQRGFVTVESGGRLQVRTNAAPAGLQPAEWQSIPRALQQDLQASSANYAFRLVEPSFHLPLRLDRHEAAKVLPARINSITLNSVISDDGVMLTQVRLDMLPGDKRFLQMTLTNRPGTDKPEFWFAFVNQNGVWPWLVPQTNNSGNPAYWIPLEQQSRDNQSVPVEIFYSSRVGAPGSRKLDLALEAPEFDLPLENITWRVHLSEKWKVTKSSGSLQLQQEEIVGEGTAIDSQVYLQTEAAAHREKTKEAEQMLAMGNSLLEKGNPQQARRAFESAYGLSQGDDAFNEDARVQLNNLKLQQALVGLNVRQSGVAGEGGTALAAKLRDLRGRKDLNYTQQDAKTIIDANTSEENATLMRLAERLIQQQDAAVSSPAAIRANIPEQGRVLTFTRAVEVQENVPLNVGLVASVARVAPWNTRLLILAVTMVILIAFGLAARLVRNGEFAGNGRTA